MTPTAVPPPGSTWLLSTQRYPSLSLPGTQTVTATGSTTSFDIPAYFRERYRLHTFSGLQSRIPRSFALGSTPVNCTATDGAGNTASGSFMVNAVDKTPPNLTVPTDQSITATGATTSFDFSAMVTSTDDLSSVSHTCTPASPGSFPLGATTVSCTATDGAGNQTTKTFKVTAVDNAAPTLTVPGDQLVAATGTTTPFNYSGMVTALDNVDTTPTINCTPGSPGPFPVGQTTVTCTATDDSAQTSAAKTFKVTVTDSVGPTITVPGNISAEATNGAGAAVTYSGERQATSWMALLARPACPRPAQPSTSEATR